jgi:hypothetical protein
VRVTPTAGSSWAAVTVPASEQRPDGSLPDGLTQAIIDFVHDLATGRPSGPDPTAVQVPVQGVAGSPPGSGTAAAVRFTGTSSAPETIAIGTPEDPAVVTLCIIKVVTAVPAPAADPTTPTTTSSRDPEPTTTTTSPDTTVDPPPDPVTLPGVIDVSPQPVAGTRDVRVWPFASDSVWNTPRGAGATFDPRQVVPGGEINSNNGFGVSVGNAGYALVDQINTNAYAESHYSIVNPDGVSAREWYQYQNVGKVNRNSSVTDLRGSGLNTRDNSLGGTSFRQQRASLVSQLGGLVRAHDLSQGVIRHALSIALPNGALKAGWVWPAFGQDGDARTAYAGFVPMGSYLGIPSNAPMPAGLSPVGQMIWTALRDYGAYVVDRGATAPMVAEASAAAAVNPARADLSRIWSQLRVVTNADRDDVGGPGNRLAPVAPDIAGG